MFSVSLLYAAKDFLVLVNESPLSPEQFKSYFKKYKYSSAEDILKISFKCGWSKISSNSNIELTERGIQISHKDYKAALLFQLEDLIQNYNPVWASLLIKGRTEAKNFLPEDAYQCFFECGLFGKLNEQIITFWDKLTLSYKNYANKRMLEIGRIGEKLSFEYEKKRTCEDPIWQSVESNFSGFDLLSITDLNNPQKLKIEVKTSTSKLDYAKCHISKNEWDTALNSINYVFHFWLINDSPKLFLVSVDCMMEHIAINQGHGFWESVEVPFKSVINFH